MSVEAFYTEHYRDIRKRLIGIPAKVKRELLKPIDEPEPVSKYKAYIMAQAEKQRKLEEAQRLIDDALLIASCKFGEVPMKTSARQIIKLVASKHGMKYADIFVKNRTRKTVAARDEAIKAVHEAWPGKGWCELGRLFDMDHSSIMASLKRSGGL
jgi:hypothetical protein